jgi:hypothetical protein
MKKDLVIKKIFIYLFFVSLISCKSLGQKSNNPITDLPKEIDTRYGIDIVPNEKTALKIAEIILEERFVNVNFNDLKPFQINLIADEKVWEIIVVEKVFKGKITTYNLRINKNTGEILNLWVIR